ncbi:MAG: EAL domain-containing protein [Azonexus sp.]|nr:EAL domain-containing protein [Azonexus sp.]MCK6411705.1 EAL domain-containing protein [Azonexus sp.]
MSNAADLYLGRQPILDQNQQIVAYELLFRSGDGNAASFADGEMATATVIANAFTELGVAGALGTCRGFINVDEKFLFSDMLELLPHENVVLEILESVPHTPAVIERCRTLHAAGFALALDDVVDSNCPDELMQLIEVIKVDLPPLSETRLRDLTARLRPLGKRLLAEKVDTRAQMELCRELGFTLFQGYYFAKPTIIAGKKLSHNQVTLMRLMTLLLNDAENKELAAVLKPEPGLTVNLLKMTNSVGAGLSHRVTSLGHAITLLGRRQLQRWLQLLVFTSGDKSGVSNPLLLLAATRGRLMEILASEIGSGGSALCDDAFMTGIMSLMPAVIGQPIEEIVAPLPLTASVRDALCTGDGLLGNLLRLAESCEYEDFPVQAEWLARIPGLCPATLSRAQTSALQWAGDIIREQGL